MCSDSFLTPLCPYPAFQNAIKYMNPSKTAFTPSVIANTCSCVQKQCFPLIRRFCELLTTPVSLCICNRYCPWAGSRVIAYCSTTVCATPCVILKMNYISVQPPPDHLYNHQTFRAHKSKWRQLIYESPGAKRSFRQKKIRGEIHSIQYIAILFL